MNKKRGMRRSQLIATGIAVLISATFLITLIIPSPTTSVQNATAAAPQNNNSNNAFEPTSAILNIENPSPYIHPSGLFQSYRPSSQSWQILQDNNSQVTTTTNNSEVVDVRFRGNQSCAVIHLLAEVGVPYESLEALNNAMPNSYFSDAWTNYGGWEMIDRNVDETLIRVDFTLRQPPDFSSFCPDTYRARSISWLSNGIAHHIRFVVRADDAASLDRLEELFIPTYITYPQNIATIDNNWQVRTDPRQTAFFVAPASWQRDPLSDDEFVTYEGPLGTGNFRISLEQIEELQVASEEEARDLVMTRIPSNAEMLSSATVQQPYSNGYRFSYTFINSEGVPSSAVITLLNNDTNGSLYISELLGSGLEADLLSEETGAEDPTVANARELAESLTIMLPSIDNL